MKITPNSSSILEGMSVQCLIEDVPESEVFEWQISYSTSGKVTASVDSAHILTLNGVEAGSVVVTVNHVTTEVTTSATCTVTVVSVPAFVDMTDDGSGEDDTTIFARQYIINNNLKRISTFNDSIEATINSIKTLSYVNAGISAANFAAVIADLLIIKEAISNISGSAGKNTVNI